MSKSMVITLLEEAYDRLALAKNYIVTDDPVADDIEIVLGKIEDILEELNLLHLIKTEKKNIKPETKEEEIIFSIMSLQPMHIDEIIKKSGLATSAVNATLMMLELKKAVRNLGKGNYVLCN